MMTHPEETSIIAPIPGAGVQHIRRENAADDAYDIAARIAVSQTLCMCTFGKKAY
jgi:hypothetical protein